MKRIQSLFNGLLACGIVFAMVATAAAQNVTQGKAKVVRIKGSARYNPGNGVWQPLHVGDVRKRARQIVVRGVALLEMGDGVRVEGTERGTEVVPFAEDGDPAQASLEAF